MLGFRVYGAYRVKGLGFRFWGLGFIGLIGFRA